MIIVHFKSNVWFACVDIVAAARQSWSILVSLTNIQHIWSSIKLLILYRSARNLISSSVLFSSRISGSDTIWFGTPVKGVKFITDMILWSISSLNYSSSIAPEIQENVLSYFGKIRARFVVKFLWPNKPRFDSSCRFRFRQSEYVSFNKILFVFAHSHFCAEFHAISPHRAIFSIL